MSTIAITSSAMLVISLILAVAMAIAWASFGRPRHALSWSIAYLLYCGEIIASIVIDVAPALRFVAGPLELICVLTPAVLVVIGARQRIALPSQARRLTVIGVLAFAVIEFLYWIPYPVPALSSAGSAFTACMLPLAIKAIMPRARHPDPAEWAAIGALAVFTIFEVVLVSADVARATYPGDPRLRALYHGVYLIGLTPVFVANGIAAILLLASDLAARLRALAANDPLTGVLNRRGFHEAALRAVANGRRYRQAVAVVLADIDHFKSINDRFGHTAGDKTLHFISGRLAKGLRKGDLVGRIGGEEFALLLVNSDAEQAAEAVDRIRMEIAAGFLEDGAPVPVTASFGVALVAAGSSSAEEMLAEALDQADRALYESKVRGRNRTTMAFAEA
jgi:diguanylate cyclase (GGDEF)-like protein